MRWVKRQNTLNVEPACRKIWKYHSHKPLPMGRGPAMYVDYKTNSQRQTEGLNGWGARIVILGGALLPVDSSAWHKIERVEDE